jgi:hypothetical protein
VSAKAAAREKFSGSGVIDRSWLISARTRIGRLAAPHGTKYRFIQRYGSGFPEILGEEFDAPFARLDWISRNRFDIQWHHLTGEWDCLYRGLTLAEAIDTLRSDGLLHPS